MAELAQAGSPRGMDEKGKARLLGHLAPGMWHVASGKRPSKPYCIGVDYSNIRFRDLIECGVEG